MINQLSRWLIALFLLLPATASALPPPSGAYRTGTTVWHWVNAGAPDTYADYDNARRELMVQAWYPIDDVIAEGAQLAPLAPLYSEWQGRTTHSYVALPVRSAPDDRGWPVLVVSPGRGVARHFYTSIVTDLASHGYVVVAVDIPYSGRVVYPDGRFIAPSSSYEIPFSVLTGPYEAVDQFFEEAAELGAKDLLFVLEQLTRLNRADPAGRFTGRMDLSRLGALGHSLGGRIIGAAVAADSRFLAYASMEGVPPRDVRRNGMDAAVMMLVSSELPDMAMPNIREVIPARRNTVILARLEGFGHNSITDLPILRGDDYQYDVDPIAAYHTLAGVLRRFFHSHVAQRPLTGIHDEELAGNVDLEIHPAQIP